MPGRAFISYRRDDSSGYAGRVYDRLQQRFPNQVFMDVSGIDAGVDFVESIEREVRASTVVVALIGKHWLEGRRLDDPDDFVNREIVLALENKIPVIPVLLRGARMPSAADLPDHLKPLARRNAVEVGEATFDRDIAALIRALEQRLDRPSAVNWKLIAIACTAVLVLAITSGFVYLWSHVRPSPTPTPTPTPAPTPVPSTPTVTPVGPTPAPVSFNFEPAAKWIVTTGGGIAGSMWLNLKPDNTYEISNAAGSLQTMATVMGNTGKWSFDANQKTLVITGSKPGVAVFGQTSQMQIRMRITGKQNDSYSAVGDDGVNYILTPAGSTS